VGGLSQVQLRGVNSGDFTLADEAISVLGQWHRGVGGAVLDTTDTNRPFALRVFHIGASGEGGIETITAGNGYDGGDNDAILRLPGRIVQAWPDDWTMPWLTTSNTHVTWTATGRISNRVIRDLGDLTFFRPAQGTMGFSARFDGIGATQAVVEVFNGPTFVGSVTLPAGDMGSLAGTARVSRVNMVVSDGTLSAILTTRAPQEFAPANGSPALTGDRFRITALNPTSTIEGLRSLITRGANVESFAFRGFNTAERQRSRLGAPRFIPGGGIMLPISTEADVSYQIEASNSLNGPWTPLGQVMGTDGTNETLFEDAVSRINNNIRLFRVRIR
jgi:hypothetical protein